MTDNRMTAELDAIRLRVGSVREGGVLLTDTVAKDDALRLLAALDAVLKEHVQTDPGWCESCAFSWPCSTVRAITSALLGEAKT